MPFACAWMTPRHRLPGVLGRVVPDFNARNRVIGIEVHDLKKRFPNAAPETIRLDVP